MTESRAASASKVPPIVKSLTIKTKSTMSRATPHGSPNRDIAFSPETPAEPQTSTFIPMTTRAKKLLNESAANEVENLSPTRRLSKQSHITHASMIRPVRIDTKQFVSMNEMKEMIEIEEEFGSCINPKVAKEEDKETKWFEIYRELRLSHRRFQEFKCTIDAAQIASE